MGLVRSSIAQTNHYLVVLRSGLKQRLKYLVIQEVIMRKYAVMYEIDYGEWMYATHENPFTYNSEPILFESFSLAETHAKKYNTSTVVEYFPSNSKISRTIKG
jgi:hypothetical protein